MKGIILVLFSALTAASSANGQIAIAPEAGLNLSDLAIKSNGSTWNATTKGGLRIGGVADISLTNNLYLQPGLFFMKNRCLVKQPDYFGTGTIDQAYSLNTLELPVNLEYKFGRPGGNRFFVGAGPYVGYNMSGKVISSGVSRGMSIGTDKPTAQGPGDDVKRIDIGAGLNVGYQFKNGVFAKAQYQMGVSNLSPTADANNSIRSSSFGITVGYFLGKNKLKSKTSGDKK